MGLHINTAKTEMQCFWKQKQFIRLSIGNVALKQVERFIYVGGKLTSNNSSSEDIVRDIGLDMRVTRSLQTIWKASSNNSSSEVIVRGIGLAMRVAR